jgi:hypothetical protein
MAGRPEVFACGWCDWMLAAQSSVVTHGWTVTDRSVLRGQVAPKTALQILAAQIGAALATLAPVYLLRW